MNKNLLALTALSNENPTLLHDLCQLIIRANCNIIHAQAKLLGEHLSICMLIEGPWDAVAKAETSITSFGKKLKGYLALQRTNAFDTTTAHIPYYVQVVALDKPGIATSVTEFFSRENIPIYELDCSSQISPLTQATIFSLNMMIFIPETLSISDMREQFLIHCDLFDLDGMMEPVK